MADQGNTDSSSYDVFLNFRGKDTRDAFTCYLYHALSCKGFNTFMDDEGLKEGDPIERSLANAIQQSRMSIVILSENYASSVWCLNELVEILECMRLKNQVVWPIFYKVEPSDVKHQTNSYAKAMAEHEEKFGYGSNEVKKWRLALSNVADLKGFNYKTGYEYALIEEVVKKTATKLQHEQLDVDEHITEHQSHIEEVESPLDVGVEGATMFQSQEPYMSMQVPWPVRPASSEMGPQHCAPCPIQLEIIVGTSSAYLFTVKDINGNTLFKLLKSRFSLRRRRVLIDAVGNPIFTLYRKIITLHDRWQIFMGGSTEQKDLLFTVKRPNTSQQKTELHVFSAKNTEENDWDFKVEGSWFERFCTVHAIESPNNIATLMDKPNNAVDETDSLIVRVETNVDYAFVISLLVILDEINKGSIGVDE